MRKYKLHLFFFLFIAYTGLNAQHRSIDFNHGRWNDILVKAKIANKIIFVDAFTSWCGPCKWMAANTFNNDSVADFFNTHFINAKIDMEKDTDGPGIARGYGVGAYPTYLFIDAEGMPVHRSCGAMAAPAFLEVGKTALDPEKQLLSIKKRVDAGDHSGPTILKYMDALSKGCINTDVLKTQYFQTLTENDLLSPANWQIIRRYENDINSREFNYLLHNINSFSKISSRDSVLNKLYDTFLYAFQVSLQKSDTNTLHSIYEKIKTPDFTRAEKLIFNIDLQRTDRNHDNKNYNALVLRFADKYKNTDASFMNNLAWRFFQQETDSKLLSKAEQWAKRAVELDPKAQYYNTYASILYKEGKKKQAVKEIENAFNAAKAKEEPTAEYEKTLVKFKEGK